VAQREGHAPTFSAIAQCALCGGPPEVNLKIWRILLSDERSFPPSV
jgi:hypothetical protein